MNDKTQNIPSITDLAAWMQGQDLADLHRIEAALDLLGGAPRTDKASRHRQQPDRVGPWDIHTAANGTVTWTVREETTLRERHSWCVKPLSSERAARSLRVVLLGSSAAASFGYWGEFSLATAIERKLQAAWPDRAIDVIDLACVNATWPSILETMRSAATLKPDIAVVYCGNNEAKTLEVRLNDALRPLHAAYSARWICDTPRIEDYPALLHACLDEHAATMSRATADCAREAGVKLVFVVPEFNLADWRPRERVPFHLSSAELQRWFDTVVAAERALGAGNANEALDGFESAIHTDGGLSRRSQWGKGQALLALGRIADARHALIQSRDAGVGAFADGIPQITHGMIEAMRRTFAELGIACVDRATHLTSRSTSTLRAALRQTDDHSVSNPGTKRSVSP